MKLYIAEKPSMARAIADIIGVIKNNDGYIECKGDSMVTWCYGHLLAQAMPGEYLGVPKGEKERWEIEALPVVPKDWILHPKDAGCNKQLSKIKELVKKSGEIISAGDPDREGQLLIDEVLNYVKYSGITKRLWLLALDRENIEKALKSVQDNKKYYPLMLSALARQRADWLVGLNLTRAFTVKAKKLISVGRVQTPTLKLVVDRDFEIENFVSKDYFIVIADINHKNGSYSGSLKTELLSSGTDEDNRLTEFALANKIVGIVKGKNGIIKDVKKENKKQDPPMPFMLSSLQKYASSAWGWSAQKTLDTLQSLYEKKLTSYPRTDCPYLPEEQYADAGIIIQNLKNIGFNYSSLDLKLKHKCWNSSKITAHNGIMPTKDTSSYKNLGSDEKKLYDRIAISFFLIFMPPYEYISTTILTDIANYIFETKGLTVVKPGFKEQVKEDETGEKDIKLPEVSAHDVVKCIDSKVESKKTTPSARFTDGTLIDAMSHIYKYIQDPEAKKILKETDGIGTEATRAGIIEELIKRQFTERKGKQIISTALGREIIGYLPETIKNPLMTAKWESYLSEIADGKGNLETFLASQVNFIKDEIENIKKKDIVIASSAASFASKNNKSKSGPACPSCKADLVLLKTKNGKPYFRCFQCKSCFWPDKKNKPGTKWNMI
jgi:DNA topoisomerase-3